MFKVSNCGKLSNKFVNKSLFICGWIDKIRSHGNIIFIDLRDKTGVLQILFIKENHKYLKLLKINSCIFAKGFMNLRKSTYLNFFLFTGKYEFIPYNIYILNLSKKLPFNVNNNYISDFVKYTNRYLNLRGFYMQNNLKFKFNFIRYLRNFFNKEFFMDIETPFLTKGSPEGARDFLIPSRLNLCKFFALPQSPQLFKQILMISTFDKYYQIVKCFRDEDSRSNRQFEFTQLDIELSFYNKYSILNIFITLIFFVFKFFINFFVVKKFFFINYYDSIKYYFSDKPDVRFKINYFNLKKILYLLKFKNYKFNNFICLKIDNGYILFGANFKNYNTFIKPNFLNTLSFLFNFNDYIDLYLQNKIQKIIKQSIIFEIYCYFNFNLYDYLIIFINNNKNFFNIIFLIINIICFSNFGLSNNLINFYFIPLWVVNFALFDYDFNLNIFNYLHNPFSSPLDFDKIYLDFNPIKSLSKSYDVIINGSEIGGGSIRNNKSYIQKKIFSILNFNLIDYKFFINALDFAPPIHGGLAFGLDRFIMTFLGIKSIKDIIAFPKTQNGYCLLTRAPVKLNNMILNHLNIKCDL